MNDQTDLNSSTSEQKQQAEADSIAREDDVVDKAAEQLAGLFLQQHICNERHE